MNEVKQQLNSGKTVLSFGCSSLEFLIDQENQAYESDGPFVACIVGPDGVGKSILSLAAASIYAANNAGEHRKVVYASTDFHFDQAISTWNHFAFDRPFERSKAIHKLIGRHSPKLKDQSNKFINEKVILRRVSPFRDDAMRIGGPHQLFPYDDIFNSFETERVVHFLDLADFSAGDDWGHLNRTIGLFADLDKASGPHLLIVDAVEGLEAMVGERDGFGLIRSRRSRLSQMVRIARKVNCCIIFVVEQKNEEERLDEVFISDLVLRLRARTKDGYMVKTVEIEKARSKPHVRGEHEFQIRSGQGISGAADDPKMSFIQDANTDSKLEANQTELGESSDECPAPNTNMPRLAPSNLGARDVHVDGKKLDRQLQREERTFGYLQVLSSLHVKEYESKERAEYSLPAQRFPSSLRQIDLLLRREEEPKITLSTDPRERVLIIVGESRTYKAPLGFAFLAQGFLDEEQFGGALLFTSEGDTSQQLENSFVEWKVQKDRFENRVAVREILPSFLSSSELLFRVRTCIRDMKTKIEAINKEIGKAFNEIELRVLIDNWATILESHPALNSDPQILQRIFRVLQDEGVLAIITSTQPGSPHAQLDLQHEHNVLRLEARRLHCWPVDFYGGRRIAITSSLASRAGENGFVHELRRSGNKNHLLEVTPDFSVFKDLESGHAKPIDLKVKLYSGYSTLDKQSTSTYSNDVLALFGDLYSSQAAGNEVVSFESIERYHGFKEYVRNLHGSKLDHTLVFQVDEFWKGEKDVFADLNHIWPEKDRAVLLEDFSRDSQRVPLHRDFGMMLLDVEAWTAAKSLDVPFWWKQRLDYKDHKLNVPAHEDHGLGWDCLSQTSIEEIAKTGMETAFSNWGEVSSALQGKDTTRKIDNRITVQDVLNNLRSSSNVEHGFQVSWPLFLDACQVVARNSGKIAFDVDLRTLETLNSLVLEIWFSKIRTRLLVPELKANIQPAVSSSAVDQTQQSETESELLSKKSSESSLETIQDSINAWSQSFLLFANGLTNLETVSERVLKSLSELLLEEESRDILLETLSLLSGYLPSRFRRQELQAGKADEDAVAIRTWYATGVHAQSERSGLIPVRLPGGFAVRGDWFLGVARGSRSMELARRAIDNLRSTSMNLKRFRQGIGLPVIKLDELGLAESAMCTIDESKNAVRRLTLTEIEGLSPRSVEANQVPSVNEPFLPIFRSRMKDYGHQCDEFLRLVTHILRTIPPCLASEELGNLNDYKDLINQCKQVSKSCEKHSPILNDPQPENPEGGSDTPKSVETV
ncbi:MAG: hypothetical protein K9M08_13685 [Pirellula sp.]|nr:hypothetical protein [Pirellula sp.]